MYTQIESDLPITPKVAGFAAVMDATLTMGGLRDQWGKLTYKQRVSRLVQECQKLQTLPQDQAFVSATIIGLFAMMVADGAAMATRASASNRPAVTVGSVAGVAEEPLE